MTQELKALDSCDAATPPVCSNPVRTNVFGTNVERDNGYSLHVRANASRYTQNRHIDFSPCVDTYLREFNDTELTELKAMVNKMLDNLFETVRKQIEIDKQVRSTFSG